MQPQTHVIQLAFPCGKLLELSSHAGWDAAQPAYVEACNQYGADQVTLAPARH